MKKKKAIETFLIAPEPLDEAIGGGGGEGGRGGGGEEDGRLVTATKRAVLIEEHLQRVAKKPRAPSMYTSMSHAKPTSNVCERLFSQLRMVFSDQRKRLHPSTLEIILFLKVNYFLWEIMTIHLILAVGLGEDIDEDEENDPFYF